MSSMHSPSDASSILNSRPSQAREPSKILESRIIDILTEGARVLDTLEGQPPVLKAKIAVLLLENLANQIIHDLPANPSKTPWSEHLMANISSAIATFKSSFSLHSDLLQGNREVDPEFAYKYILMRGLFHNRLPVMSSDLKDSLAVFSVQKSSDGEKNMSTTFRGVREAINNALTCGPFFIVTGDTHETVLDKFLIPNGWVAKENGNIVPTNSDCENLYWLPRTGMDIVTFNRSLGIFERKPLIAGIQVTELSQISDILDRNFIDCGAADFFNSPGRCYNNTKGKVPGSKEIRASEGNNDYSIAFYPAGVLEFSERSRFEADKANAPFLERMVCSINKHLSEAGLAHIMAKRGGLSTIDIVTSDKGLALKHIKNSLLNDRELLAFIGDKIALNGNDREGAEVADLSVQVGHEWDRQLPTPGGKILLRSKRIASEGGAAEFISILTTIRRLGLTGLLSHPNGSKRITQPTLPADGSIQLSSFTMPHITPLAEREIYSDVLATANQLVTLGVSADEETLRPLAKKIRSLLSPISSENIEQFTDLSPIEKIELQILKRVVDGGTPVLASDLKDTLAVFDSTGVTWFPGVKESLIDHLRIAPFYLITGDSMRNLSKSFLEPAGIIKSTPSGIEFSFPGIHNLHLITRTGLDRVIFNFASGKLERSQLVAGIAKKDVGTIRDILQTTAEYFHCSDFFKSYPAEQTRPAGHVEMRGLEYGEHDASFAFFPAGVLLKEVRDKFRSEMTNTQIFHAMIAHIRRELREHGFDNVLAQQGGISTIDLTTTTKGTALAELKKQTLSPNGFIIYIGDTVTQNGNDGSTVGVADFTIQVGRERDENLSPPPMHYHAHSPVHARDGGAVAIIKIATLARNLSSLNVWSHLQ